MKNLLNIVDIPKEKTYEALKSLNSLNGFIQQNKKNENWGKLTNVWDNFIEYIDGCKKMAPFVANTLPLSIAFFHAQKNMADIANGEVSPNKALKMARGEDMLSFVCSRLNDLAYSLGSNPNSDKTIFPLMFTGVPILHASIAFENYNSFKDALRHGAKLDTVTADNEYPIHYIFSRIGEPHVNTPNKDIHNIYRNESIRLIRDYVIENTKDVNVLDKAQRSALFYAVENPNTLQDIIYLLKKGASVDLQDWQGNSPLHLAVKNNCLDVLDVLKGEKPNPNFQNKHGKTPLHLAAERQETQLMRKLVDMGADITIKDNAGKTAAEYLSPEKRHEWRTVRNDIPIFNASKMLSRSTVGNIERKLVNI